jgi:Cu+-exporting ATPase
MADTPFSLRIEGMHCGGCVRRVHKALGDIPGVDVDTVEVGAATGSFDAADTDVAELVAAVAQLGFQASPVPSAG